MTEPRPITLNDIRRATRVYVTLSFDSYWQAPDEVLDESAIYPGLDDTLDLPDPCFARIAKPEALAVVRRFQDLGDFSLLGNTLDLNFFHPRKTWRNLYIHRIHAPLPQGPTLGNPKGIHERTLTESDVEKASDVYVRLPMDWSHFSMLEQRFGGRGRRLHSYSSVRRVQILKSEAQRIVREFIDSEYDYWSVFGTFGTEDDGPVVRILGLGSR